MTSTTALPDYFDANVATIDTWVRQASGGFLALRAVRKGLTVSVGIVRADGSPIVHWVDGSGVDGVSTPELYVSETHKLDRRNKQTQRKVMDVVRSVVWGDGGRLSETTQAQEDLVTRGLNSFAFRNHL